MKIRNFAFFGVMAAIFATASANATETTRQLATKQYVDNKAADANYRSNAAYAANTIGKAIKDVETKVGDATMTTTADTVTGAINELNTAIGSVTSTAGTALQDVTANSDAGVVTNVAANGTHVTMTKALVAKTDLAQGVQSSLDKADAADELLGDATMTTTADTVTGAINELNTAIGSVTSTAGTALQDVTANSDAGVVTNVAANGTHVTMTKALVTNSDIAAAGTANIAYGKMETGLIGLDIETSPDCSTTNPCMLTYVGNNTYKWTNMIESTDETLTAVQQ